MIRILYYHLQLFLMALSLLSWIPVPAWGHTTRDSYKMAIYFPFVGMVLGSISSIFLYVSNLFFPFTVSVALTLLFITLLTGAFHEDALADVADGLGANQPGKIIEIMRDSRIGTYGAMALISSYVVRYASLSSLPFNDAVYNLVLVMSASRLAGVFFLILTKQNEKPIESLSHTLSLSGKWWTLIPGFLMILILQSLLVPNNLLFTLLIVILIPKISHRYFMRRIKCITGDCSGFVIHVSETILFSLATIFV